MLHGEARLETITDRRFQLPREGTSSRCGLSGMRCGWPCDRLAKTKRRSLCRYGSQRTTKVAILGAGRCAWLMRYGRWAWKIAARYKAQKHRPDDTAELKAGVLLIVLLAGQPATRGTAVR